MKKVLVVVPNLKLGGQQRAALELCSLIQEKCKVYLAVFDGTDVHYSIPGNVELIDLEVHAANNRITRCINVVRRLASLKSIKKKKNIDVSIGFGHTADLSNCLARQDDFIISTIHNTVIIERGKNIIDNVIVRRSDNLVFVSKGQMDFYRGIYPQYKNKMEYCYNACDLEEIDRLKNESIDEAVDFLTFVACGRLSPEKCFINLINTFTELKKKYPDIKLIIIGSGQQKEQLDDYIKERKVENTVRLIGFKKNPFAYISKSRGLCCSSYREAFSLSVLEGLACGVPVISTDCRYGPREILSDDDQYSMNDDIEIKEYGILTPSFKKDVKNQKELESLYAKAIDRLLSDVELEKRYRLRATERSRKFSLEAYKDFWIRKIYHGARE